MATLKLFDAKFVFLGAGVAGLITLLQGGKLEESKGFGGFAC